MLKKDIWLTKTTKINCFNIEKPYLNKINLKIKKNILISCKFKKNIKKQKKENINFRFVGENIIFKKKINPKLSPVNGKIDFQISKNRDKKKLIELCIKNMKSSRFDLDKKFPINKTKEIRKKWILGYFENSKNKIIFSAKINKKLVGLLCIIKKKKDIFIDLIAITKNNVGNGIGQNILNKLELEFSKWKNIFVGTYEENKKAINFYKKNGFKKINYYKVYHYYEK